MVRAMTDTFIELELVSSRAWLPIRMEVHGDFVHFYRGRQEWCFGPKWSMSNQMLYDHLLKQAQEDLCV